MARDKCLLAYSGGLDTSVAIKWIAENYDLDVIALVVDVGQERQDLEFVRQKALSIGAIESVCKDVREEYVDEFLAKALKANALYENKYPLLSAMSRPIIVKHLVEEAHRHRAKYIAHGCTGKGNDQVRFEVGISALDPDIEVLAPVREWELKTREQEMDWAAERGIPVPTTKDNPYSIDDNLWGRAIECGVLEDPWVEPPADIYTLTNDARGDTCGSEPEYAEISFEQGVPVALNGELMSFHEIINAMNELAGKHGFGRIDMIENRLIGVKSREIYEVPGALDAHHAHKALEDLCLEREVLHYKLGIEQKWADLVYNGMWFSPAQGGARRFHRDHSAARYRRRATQVLSRLVRDCRPAQPVLALRLQPGDLRRRRHVRSQGREGLHRSARPAREGLGAPAPQGRQGGRGLGGNEHRRLRVPGYRASRAVPVRAVPARFLVRLRPRSAKGRGRPRRPRVRSDRPTIRPTRDPPGQEPGEEGTHD